MLLNFDVLHQKKKTIYKIELKFNLKTGQKMNLKIRFEKQKSRVIFILKKMNIENLNE